MIALTSRQDAALTLLLYLAAWLVVGVAAAGGLRLLQLARGDLDLQRHERARAALRRACHRVSVPPPTSARRVLSQRALAESVPFDYERDGVP